MSDWAAAAPRALRVAEAESPRKAPRRQGQPLLPLHERDIARLWETGQLPPAAIVAQDGTPLQVVYRGRPNSGAGPDFRDAIIALPDARLLRGDVELHLLASDFRRHGHDRDPAYARVILHLVYRADDGPETVLCGGRRAPVVSLERWLEARAAQIEAMLQQPALWREPCETAPERLGSEATGETLSRLGERRLFAKAAAVAHRDAAAALYEGLLRALGHGAQVGAWLDLGRRLPYSVIAEASKLGPPESVQALESLLLASAGLLPPLVACTGLGQSEAYIISGWERWHRHGAPRVGNMSAGGPRRPANHPARRLAGLARLLCDGPGALLSRARLAILSGRTGGRALLDLLTIEAGGDWMDRIVPWGALAAAATPLIGRDKAIELAVNAVLPVLLAEGEREKRPLLSGAALRAFHALPSTGPYGRTAHLSRALRSEGESLTHGADRAQGALHLYAHYCTRGGCGRCPLS